MTMVFARIDDTERDGITVARLLDRNVNETSQIDEWSEEMSELLRRKKGERIVIDFTNVNSLSSLALNRLVQIRNQVRQDGGKLCLCGMRFEIMEVFNITRLYLWFYIAPTLETALTAPWQEPKRT